MDLKADLVLSFVVSHKADGGFIWLRRHGTVVYCQCHREGLCSNAHRKGMRSGWCINRPKAWLSGVSTWPLSCTGNMKSCALTWPLINPQLWKAWASLDKRPPFCHGFHLWQVPGKTASCKHCSPPSWCHRSSVPKANLTLMQLGWKWEPRCQPATWLLMQSGEMSVPQAICGHPCVLHMALHKSLQRIGKGD